MFIGLNYHQLEIKGRLAIPPRFRQNLKSGSVITSGLDGCLFLFPASYWQKLSSKLASLPLTNPSARQFTRLIVQSAAELKFDKQGRTLIPEHLKVKAKLKKQVVVAGALTRVEIWDKDLYHQHLEKITRQLPLDQELAKLGI